MSQTFDDTKAHLKQFREQRHFLQSEAWGEFQRSQGNSVVTRSGPGWTYLAIEEHGKVGNRLYCPYGPTAESVEALRDALDDLNDVARQRKVDFVRVEPRLETDEDMLRGMGLLPSHHNVQPADTIVNLVDRDAVSAEDIVGAMKGNARRSATKAQKEGVLFRTSQDPADMQHFLEMIHDVAERTGMKPHEDEYFQAIADTLFPVGRAGLMLAELDGKPIGSLIYFTDGDTMSYAHAASYTEYRKLSVAAGLLLYAMLQARESGHRFFDTYGVAPEDAPQDHPWNGFTKFKQSFAGDRVALAGTWELPVKKLKYQMYSRLARTAENR